MMKHLLHVLFLLAATLSLSAQVCTPDGSINKTGVYPRILPDATPGVAYHETIQFKFPTDTTYAGMQAHIDSVRIDSVGGFPPGFTYMCSNPGCHYASGANGCALITGNPTAGMAGDYTIKVYALAFISFSGTSFPAQYTDQLPLKVAQPVGLYEQPEKAASVNFGIAQNYPNPFSKSTEIKFFAPEAQTAGFRVYDILGNSVYTKDIKARKGENSYIFERANLPEGMYFYSLQLGTKVLTKRMMIKN